MQGYRDDIIDHSEGYKMPVMIQPSFTEAKNSKAIKIVVTLAYEIWNEHYVPLIGQEQVDYMLRQIQSAGAIAGHIKDGYRYFLIKYGNDCAGYVAVLAEPSRCRMYLSKLYVKKSFRGRGIARAAITFIEELCLENKLSTIWLNVNRHNPSVKAYKRMGFKKTGVMVTDIGNDFVMDDFKMEKKMS